MTFDTAEACADARDERSMKIPYGSGRKRGERQVRCEACRRWCYVSDRCNLFTTVRSTLGKSEQP